MRNVIGLVARIDDSVVGFMLYELEASRVHLINLAVCQGFRQYGIGRAMVGKLTEKLSDDASRRSQVIAEVGEANLTAQLFFRSLEFRATAVIRNFYDDVADDAYRFQFDKPQVPDEPAWRERATWNNGLPG